jgi:hypothetical protein
LYSKANSITGLGLQLFLMLILLCLTMAKLTMRLDLNGLSSALNQKLDAAIMNTNFCC